MNLQGKNFINLEDYTKDELLALLNYAAELKKIVKNGKADDILKNKTLIMYFAKPSLRTRLSFEIGMKKLGGNTAVLKQDEIILGKRESIEDTARVISKYADAVMIRTFAHEDIEIFAKFSDVPVINALTDLSHPCQIMADLLTIKEHFGRLNNLILTYRGDGNNVTHSLLLGCSMLGIDISVATPVGYEPKSDYVKLAQNYARENNSLVELHNEPLEAAEGANILYTDVWTSMGQEAEKEERQKLFKNYQINTNLIKFANKDCIVLHCLPAHKGEEISEDIFEQNAAYIFNEAENRMYAQMAILAAIIK